MKVTDIWGFNAALEWDPPKDNGNCDITGYTIQKADMKTKVREEEGVAFRTSIIPTVNCRNVQLGPSGLHSDAEMTFLMLGLFSICDLCVFNAPFFSSLQEWFTIYEHNRRANCTASDLIMGNEYMFRVYSENLCGLSEESRQSKNTAVIAKTGGCTCVCTVCVQIEFYTRGCL